MANIKYFYL